MRLGRLRHPIISYRRTRVLPRWVRVADRAINRRVNRVAASPQADDWFRRISRAADRGRLWFALAAVLVAVGRPRAALRGVVSLTVASAIANLIGKRMFGGPRPIWKDIPVGRRLAAYPTSASFPSGHSASAAAFAAGVAIESPLAGAAVAPLAASVAYSRVHVGAHWASDVVGGVTIGLAVAAAGGMLVRTPRALDTSVAHTGERVSLPASPEGAGILLVLNERAGAAVIRTDPRPAFDRDLPLAKVAEMADGVTMDDIVRSAVASDAPPRILAVYGGDGSVSRMAHLARELSLPMLALPGGTFNHFVRAVGVKTLEIGVDAVHEGEGLRVAVGSLAVDGGAGLTVLNTASVGIYPDFVAERERRERRWGKWVAGIVAAGVVVSRARPIDVDIDGEPARVWSLFVSVGRNDPGRVSTMQRTTLADDVLDVRVLHARGSRLRAFGSLAFGSRTATALRILRLLPPASDVERRLVREVTLEVRSADGTPVPYAHDGELEESPRGDGERYTLHLAIHPEALDVYAPTE